jgi:dTMP kinase
MTDKQAKDGIFISCEGGEGVGKTLFLTSLSQKLKSLGVSTLVTREPGGTGIGEQIRQIFSHPPEGEPLTAEAELFLLSAARAQHVMHKVIPTLKRGVWVLCDRYYDSTYVYQGLLRQLNHDFVDYVVQSSIYGIQPRLTFLLDCSTEVSFDRLQRREEEKSNGFRPTRFDKAQREQHESIRQAYLSLAKDFPQRIEILDAQLSARDMAEQALKILKSKGLLA